MEPIKFNLKPYTVNADKITKDSRAAKEENEAKENDKPQSMIKPDAKAVVAKSEDLLSNYIKAELNKNVNAASTVQQNTASEDACPVSADGDDRTQVETLIDEWSQNSENWSDVVKVDKLTEIIEILEGNGQNADIWRLRRFTVIHNMNTEQLFQYQCWHMDERPGRPYVEGDNFYEKYNADYTVYTTYSRMYFTTGIADDEMRSAFLEAKLSREVRWLEAALVDHYDNPNDPQSIALAKTNAQLSFVAFTQYADNIENAPWKAEFVNFQNKFTEFQNHISQYSAGTIDESVIESDTTDMRTMLHDMSENGLSYFNNRSLIFCIIGCLVSVGLRHLWPGN